MVNASQFELLDEYKVMLFTAKDAKSTKEILAKCIFRGDFLVLLAVSFLATMHSNHPHRHGPCSQHDRLGGKPLVYASFVRLVSLGQSTLVYEMTMN